MRTNRKSQARTAYRNRLHLEALEDRTLLSAGALDPTFGEGGLVTTNFRSDTIDSAAEVALSAVQGDGKIVVAGTARGINTFGPDFALVRYNSDGSVDESFGAEGRVLTNVSGNDVLGGLAVQNDGKIVISGFAGFAGGAGVLLRYNVDGSLDSTFDGDGTLIVSGVEFGDVAIQDDGKMVVGGFDNGDMLIARFNADGTPDTDFGGGDGEVTLDLGGSEIVRAIALDGDKIVAAGSEFGGNRLILARYNSDGTPDESFSGDGVVVDPDGQIPIDLAVDGDGRLVIAGSSTIRRYTSSGVLDESLDTDGIVATGFVTRSVNVGPDGAIVAAGFTSFTSGDFAVARFLENGTADDTFDGDGVAITDFGGDEGAAGATIQSNGKIIVAGTTNLNLADVNNEFAVAQYNVNGSLDGDFGEGGKVITNVGKPGFDTGRDLVASQADGKIVVVGSSAIGGLTVARYDPDGRLDPTFGDEGKAAFVISSESQTAVGVELQADGKILVLARTTFSFFSDVRIIRINADGTRDGNFGGSGVADVGFSRFSDAIGFGIDADDNIVAAANYSNSRFPVEQGVTVVRFDSEGIPDESFGDAGRVLTPTGFRAGTALAVQPDRKVVVTTNDGNVPGVLRYNVDGSPDLSFGDDGKAVPNFGINDPQPVDVAVQPDGSILLAGSIGGDFALARLDSDGSADKTFGTSGLVVTDFGGNDFASSLTLQADGRIVVTGRTRPTDSFSDDFALARYTADGKLDPTFGDEGLVTTDFFGGSDQVNGVTLQADGKILAVGVTRAFERPTRDDWAIARYEGVSAFNAEILDLINDVQALVGQGTLNQGTGNSLLIKLEGALQRADAGNVSAAANKLEAFIKEVNDFVAKGELISEQGGILIDKASVAIAVLVGNPIVSASAPPSGNTSQSLNQESLVSMFNAAITLWQNAGVDTSALTNVQLAITDLNGGALSVAYGNTIVVDVNAGGWGWFVDATPLDNSEFTTDGDQGEQDRIDLLSVLVQQIGHLLGLDLPDDDVVTAVAAGERTTIESTSPLDFYFAILGDD